MDRYEEDRPGQMRDQFHKKLKIENHETMNILNVQKELLTY
jgi:hypothetical protein